MAIISDIPRKPSNITDFRCPKTTVDLNGPAFAALKEMRKTNSVRAYGVSVCQFLNLSIQNALGPTSNSFSITVICGYLKSVMSEGL